MESTSANTGSKTIIGRTLEAIRESGSEGLTFHDIKQIQAKYGKSGSEDSASGAVGSIVARLSRRRAIYTDRSVKPFRYKISQNGGHREESPEEKKNPIAFGYERGMSSAIRRFAVEIETVVRAEVNRRVKAEVRSLVENL